MEIPFMWRLSFILAIIVLLPTHSIASTILYTALPAYVKGSWWKPVPGTSWQWQLSETIDTSFAVDMYDLDLFDVNKKTIQELHNKNIIVICYISAGSWEEYRSDAEDFPGSLLGNSLEGWPGERWLDIRQLATLAPIMARRMDLAVEKGCDGIEPDNIDGYQNRTGFPLTHEDQLQYNIWLAKSAHSRGLSIGLKNDLAQAEELVNFFDWALNEECFTYDECDLLLPFIKKNKAVFGVEYTLSTEIFCSKANSYNFDFLLKNRDLDSYRKSCR